MSKKRIIPIFTYKGNVLVKSIKYDNYRNVNSIIPIIKLFNKRSVDEMIFLNLNDAEIDYDLLKTFVNEVDYPITYGGGISNIDDMRKIYNLGFDKICLNSVLYKEKEFSKTACDIFGKQSIVASIDVKKINGIFYCFYGNGKINSKITIQEHIENIINDDSISEIIVTDIDKDGTLEGFNSHLYYLLKDYNIRIIINGGGNYDERNITDCINIKNVYGVCFSSLFFFKKHTPNDIKQLLVKNGIACSNPF